MPDPQESRRVFFAIWPDAAALDALDEAAHAGVKLCGGRRMRRDSLHLTLAFIGAVTPSQLELLQEVAARVQVAPFELALDRLGWWHHNRILWAGCQSVPSGQRRLFEELSQELAVKEFQLDSRPYVPHLTLVRQARCAEVPLLDKPIAWPVTAFTLVESFLQPSGARYRVLARWSLHANA